jgi:hypothetical protein
MTYRLACELSSRFAAFAPVAVTYRNDTCNPDEPVALQHFHSELDDNVPLEGGPGNGPSVVDWLPLDSTLAHFVAYGGCLDETVTQETDSLRVTSWNGCQIGSAVELYLTSDGGHSWPGGTRTVIGDPISEAVDASREMWKFFRLFRRAVPDGLHGAPPQPSLPTIRVFPNPASAGTDIGVELDIDVAGLTDVLVYDVMGRRMQTVAFGHLSAGRHVTALRWPQQARGAYVVVVQSPSGRATAIAIRD